MSGFFWTLLLVSISLLTILPCFFTVTNPRCVYGNELNPVSLPSESLNLGGDLEDPWLNRVIKFSLLLTGGEITNND